MSRSNQNHLRLLFRCLHCLRQNHSHTKIKNSLVSLNIQLSKLYNFPNVISDSSKQFITLSISTSRRSTNLGIPPCLRTDLRARRNFAKLYIVSEAKSCNCWLLSDRIRIINWKFINHERQFDICKCTNVLKIINCYLNTSHECDTSANFWMNCNLLYDPQRSSSAFDVFSFQKVG